MKALRTAWICITNFDLVVAGSSLAALVILTTIGVFMRYVLNRPLSWMEEVQLILFVWMAFFGSSATFRAGSHIAIEVVVDWFPTRWQRRIEVVNSLLVVFVLAYVAYLEFARGQSLLRSGRATSILQIPNAVNYFGVSAACLFMLINFVWRQAVTFAGWRRGVGSGEATG